MTGHRAAGQPNQSAHSDYKSEQGNDCNQRNLFAF